MLKTWVVRQRGHKRTRLTYLLMLASRVRRMTTMRRRMRSKERKLRRDELNLGPVGTLGVAVVGNLMCRLGAREMRRLRATRCREVTAI